MSYWDDAEVIDKHQKWSQWTMKPKKKPVKATTYAAGIVFAMSAGFVVALIFA